MARGGITKTKILLLRGAKRAGSGISNSSGTAPTAAERSGISKSSGGKIVDSTSTCWVPHPRTGIYFPKGHEWVMDDVPEGAACFSETYWFRNVDGVDNPNL